MDYYRTGVYCIVNLVTCKRYIGSTAEGLQKRMGAHRYDLRRGRHYNKHLQYSWGKYGEDSFAFLTLEWCPPSVCLDREAYWIHWFRATDGRYGYNICPHPRHGTLGVKYGEEVCAKHRLFKMSPEHRETLRRLNHARICSRETRDKYACRQRRLWKDPEYRAQQVAKRSGKKQSKETICKRAKSLRGKKR